MSIERVEGQSHVTVSVLLASGLTLVVGGESFIDTSPVSGVVVPLVYFSVVTRKSLEYSVPTKQFREYSSVTLE
jgi:hypothetical protein